MDRGASPPRAPDHRSWPDVWGGRARPRGGPVHPMPSAEPAHPSEIWGDRDRGPAAAEPGPTDGLVEAIWGSRPVTPAPSPAAQPEPTPPHFVEVPWEEPRFEPATPIPREGSSELLWWDDGAGGRGSPGRHAPRRSGNDAWAAGPRRAGWRGRRGR